MLLLYHKFIKNARTVFLRGMILCFRVGMLNDKIFHFSNLSSKKSLIFASELLPIVVPVGLFLCSFSSLSVDRALEFSSSFRCRLFIVFFLTQFIFHAWVLYLFPKNSQCLFKGHILSIYTRHLCLYLPHDEMSTHVFVGSLFANELKLLFYPVVKLSCS